MLCFMGIGNLWMHRICTKELQVIKEVNNRLYNASAAGTEFAEINIAIKLQAETCQEQSSSFISPCTGGIFALRADII